MLFRPFLSNMSKVHDSALMSSVRHITLSLYMRPLPTRTCHVTNSLIGPFSSGVLYQPIKIATLIFAIRVNFMAFRAMKLSF